MKNSTLEVQAIPASLPYDAIIPAPADVGSYLQEHTALANLLPPICRSTRTEFGPSAELTLEVYHDPEVEDHYLALIVRLPAYDDSTMRRIDAIWERFESELADGSGWLTITTDFRLLKVNHGI
jgi:hypothetical protein